CPPPSLDQRGYGRPASGSTLCDIGAYEFGATDASVSEGVEAEGQVQPVGTGRPKGGGRLRFRGLLPHGLGLRRGIAHFAKGLTERGVELVKGLPELAWIRTEGAKAQRATFKTEAGQRAKGKVELQIRGDELTGQVQLDQVEVDAPRLCGDEGVELE